MIAVPAGQRAQLVQDRGFVGLGRGVVARAACLVTALRWLIVNPIGHDESPPLVGVGYHAATRAFLREATTDLPGHFYESTRRTRRPVLLCIMALSCGFVID